MTYMRQLPRSIPKGFPGLPALVNVTAACSPPLLDQSNFGATGGYEQGRYCGLGAFGDGTTCCFPCPIQDWVYSSEWEHQLRVPNYLSIISVILCCFLLLSFAVLPASATHRHYLSVGLLFPVLAISLSFAIPISTNPDLCYDEITPNDMRSSMSCAWTGALVTLGGLGCVIWVFLRSLWLHVRIVWDVAPGRCFKWGSIAAGTLLPLAFLIAMLAVTGFSYRMGQTCLPNHNHAIITFWVWLVSFGIAGFLLQLVTTGYCVVVYFRTLRQERSRQSRQSRPNETISTFEHGNARLDTWRNVKKLFLLQWRNILVNVFVFIGSIAFFIVFWSQDRKLGRVDNNPDNLLAVKTWIVCQTLSQGDKDQCIEFVKDFTVSLASVLTSLILASLVGIEIFILLFRRSMLHAWMELLRSLSERARNLRRRSQGNQSNDTGESPPPSPSKRPPLVSAFSSETPTTVRSSDGTILTAFTNSASYRGDMRHSWTPTISTPNRNSDQDWDREGLYDNSSTEHEPPSQPSADIEDADSFIPRRNAPAPPTRDRSRTYNHFSSPSPAQHGSSELPEQESQPSSGSPNLSIQRTNSSKIGKLKRDTNMRISNPVPGSFVHVNGAFIARDGSGRGRRKANGQIDTGEEQA